jgi:glycosyltransferase involved in cell wall biosynthesis
MKFLFVVSGRDVPSTRFRILPYIPLLEQAGHRCDVAYSWPQKYDYFPQIGWRLSQLLKRSVRRVQTLMARFRNYDAIVIEREVFDNDSSEIEEKLRQCTGRLILDVDDGIFLLHPEKFDRISRICDIAIAGNAWLRQYLTLRCDVVMQIPTCVRLSEYPQREPEAQRKTDPKVGWIGTTHNVGFLSVAQEALRRVYQMHEFSLLVVAPSKEKLRSLDLGAIPVDFRQWSPSTEINDLLDMDLGLMPLPDGEEWMKYKCGLKLIQYLAVGIPGVASPIGVNQEILEGNSVGRAASNTRQWEEALAELLADSHLRRRLGAKGRQLVEEHYSIEGNLSRLEACLCEQLDKVKRIAG